MIARLAPTILDSEAAPARSEEISMHSQPTAAAVARVLIQGALLILLLAGPAIAQPLDVDGDGFVDQFTDVVKTILKLVNEHPEVLKTVPHFTPIDRVDEVSANKSPMFAEKITQHLPDIIPDRVDSEKLRKSTAGDLCELIIKAHQAAQA